MKQKTLATVVLLGIIASLAGCASKPIVVACDPTSGTCVGVFPQDKASDILKVEDTPSADDNTE